MILENIILIVLTAVILRYVLELEAKGCECSRNKQRDFLKYFSPVVILVGLIGILVSRKSIFNAIRGNRLLLLVAVVYGFVAVLHSINMIVYFLRLRFSNCECSKNWKQWGLLYPALALAVVILVVFGFLIFSFLGLIPSAVKKITGKNNENANNAKELLNTLTNNNKRGVSNKMNKMK
jgi:hypothetical protein